MQVVGGFSPEVRLEVRDQSAARYAWDKGEPAGHGSDRLPTARWFFLPLVAETQRLQRTAFDLDQQIRCNTQHSRRLACLGLPSI